MMIMNDKELREYQQKVAQILISEYFPETDFQVDTPIITKNNNIQKYGITIRPNDSNVAPTFYMEDYIEHDYEPEETALSICNTFISEKVQSNVYQRQVDELKDFEKCKDKICYRIINKQKNMDLEESSPTITIAPDLMIVFYLQVSKDETCLINNNFIDTWGLTENIEKTLFEIADANTERLHPTSFQCITEVLRGVIPDDLLDELAPDNPFSIPMYVLSNEDHTHGASTILYRNGKQLRECFDQLHARFWVKDIYIIPSSIHEWILVPALPYITKEKLQSICQEVNQQQVPDTEFLSDNIFSYDINNGFQQRTYTYRQMQQAR